MKTLSDVKRLRVVKEIFNGKSTDEALEAAGYSKESNHIVSRKPFRELLDEVMPEAFVADQHKRLYSEHRNLKEVRINTTDPDKIAKAIEGYENASYSVNEAEGYTTLIINEVDRQARKDAVDMAYKLRGAFAPDKVVVKRELEDLSDDELMALLQGNQKD